MRKEGEKVHRAKTISPQKRSKADFQKCDSLNSDLTEICTVGGSEKRLINLLNLSILRGAMV